MENFSNSFILDFQIEKKEINFSIKAKNVFRTSEKYQK